MAKVRTPAEQLQAENERLRVENEQLRQTTVIQSGGHHAWRRTGVVCFMALAVALLVVGNLLFWTGNTIVNNERFNQATAPIIRDSTVQTAVASYTTAQIYNNVDVERQLEQALPPRITFLAPTLASQLRGGTQAALQKVLARPQFQDHWNALLARSHAGFIATVKQSGGDGVIDLNDLYQQLSQSLKGTKLDFLAGKQLPSKVGDVQVLSGSGITVLHKVAVHINTWRTVAVLLFLVSAALAIYLSRRRRRRRTTAMLALYCAIGLLVTLIAVRITREIIAGKAMSQYMDAVRQTVQIIFHPLVIQTTTLLALFALIAVAAWLTGASRSAHAVQDRLHLLFAGKLHQTIFGDHENTFTRWVGAHKRLLQWATVAVIVVLLLVTSLTLTTLAWYAVIAVIAVLLIELLGAPTQSPTAILKQ
ncbi:MAG TPA: hypothetical protein VLE99_06435 [Candidatus Saccharimonadales bacterium]|nr:hypothetical protein [Candidatus Saccharimonadales bacterium]